MTSKTQCLRGMRDIKPDVANKLLHIEQTLIKIAQEYGYQCIQFPILESTDLFTKSIGIETDIVGQEMYTFKDKNESYISLRPEGTAGCLRSVIANSLIQRNKLKVFYTGPMFRRERPQQGRFRQFEHFGIEVFGYQSGLIDVELIEMSNRMWDVLGLKNISLHINYLGSPQSRKKYHGRLIEYWQKHFDRLSESEQQRAINNPLRLLDSKNPDIQDLIDNAPTIIETLNEQEQVTYQSIKDQLDQLGIAYIESHKLVRGLDYYSDFIFEWISSDLGAQSTICGGGRYDSLVESMGHKIPATGFAAGIDRIECILAALDKVEPSVYLCSAEDHLISDFMPYLAQARDSNCRIEFDPISGKIKNKLKQATDKAHTFAGILQQENEMKLINMSTDTAETISYSQFIKWCQNGMKL